MVSSKKERQQRRQQQQVLDLTPKGGTPLSKLFSCCIPAAPPRQPDYEAMMIVDHGDFSATTKEETTCTELSHDEEDMIAMEDGVLPNMDKETVDDNEVVVTKTTRTTESKSTNTNDDNDDRTAKSSSSCVTAPSNNSVVSVMVLGLWKLVVAYFLVRLKWLCSDQANSRKRITATSSSHSSAKQDDTTSMKKDKRTK